MNREKIEIAPRTPREKRRMLCPHCDQRLPIDPSGECDHCGAHLRVVVETIAPPQGGEQ